MQQLCYVLASGEAYPPRLIALIAAQAVPRPKMLPMEKAEPTLPIENALPTEPAPADSVLLEQSPRCRLEMDMRWLLSLRQQGLASGLRTLQRRWRLQCL